MTLKQLQTIGIVGAGAWGTALALAAARAGRDVILWGQNRERMDEIAKRRVNTAYLPHLILPSTIHPTHEHKALSELAVILLVTPAQRAPAIIGALSETLSGLPVLLLCSKGIEAETGRFLSETIRAQLASTKIGALSGPSFATDVARGLPTAVTLAIEDEGLGAALAAALGSASFRPYWTSDVRGVEIGGALKNVYAIAAGIVVGRSLGDSARAALIARAFAEMGRFGAAMGAHPGTLSGLSGLGDLVLTATSEHSRNLRFGLCLGRGEDFEDARSRLGTVEGIATAGAVVKIAGAHLIDMPIAQAIAAIVHSKISVDDAIDNLMRRPLKAEI